MFEKGEFQMVVRIILLTIVSIYLVGCMNQNAQQNEGIDNKHSVEQTGNHNEVTSNNEIANHLANIASEVPDVENAVAIVAGPYAVVGIDVDEKLDRQRVGTIKFSVNEAMRDDPYGKTAVVVADPDTTERIRNMRKRMQQGEPIQGVVDELADIVGRLMPTFPVEERDSDEIDQEDGTIIEDRGDNNTFNKHDDIQNDDSRTNDTTDEKKSGSQKEQP